MKELLTNFGLLLCLSVAFSAMTGCSGGSSEVPARSDYPPVASSVANADIKELDGKTFKVADKKGKVLLLNLWATWCGPCRSEMPALVRMQEAHGGKGLEIIGLNTDEEPADAINKFAGEMNLNYTLAWADTGLQAALLNISKFDGIPQSFLIDRDGNLRSVFRGANPKDVAKMEEIVAKVVNGESTPAETGTAEKGTQDANTATSGPATIPDQKAVKK